MRQLVWPERTCGECVDGYHYSLPHRNGWSREPGHDDAISMEWVSNPGLAPVRQPCRAWRAPGWGIYMAPARHHLVMAQLCNCVRAVNTMLIDDPKRGPVNVPYPLLAEENPRIT